jgi:predicted Zn-dependent protease
MWVFMKRYSVVLLGFILLLSGQAHAMTYEDERTVAKDFINLLEANNLIVHDPEIVWPVQMISEKLADHVRDPVYNFKVHIVRDRSVNAFTIPDGHIFVNLGLLLFSQDMDEIAAVIGHEMGHSQLRHIPENFNTQMKINTATILGVLAGTLLSSKNPEAGAAMIFSSLGGTENIRLAYSRQHEFSSDEFGRNLLRASGIDSSAMARFLIRLHAFSGTSGIPEYLLTHPFTQNRIATIAEDPGKPRPGEAYWTLSACMAGLILPSSEAGMRTAQMPEPYRSLAQALSNTRSGNYAQALAQLEKIDLSVAKAYQGLSLHALGRNDEAYPLLKEHARSARTRTALAEILQERGEFDEAIKVIQPYQGRDVRVDYTLGILYEKAKKQTLAHVSFGRYFFRTESYEAGRYHIEAALKDKDNLPPDVLEELKTMHDMIKERKQSGR